MHARILFLFFWLNLANAFAQVRIVFEEPQIVALRNQEIEVVVRFQEAVPQGLEGYHLRLNHPTGTVDSTQTAIEVPPDLDFGFFEPPALRDIDATGASIRGFVEFGAPAYIGTDFVTFRLRIAPNAPYGAHPLTLSIPRPESFVNGNLEVIDGQILLGSATLNIVPFLDLNTNNVPDTWELDFYPTLDAVPASVTIDDVELTIEELYIANLDPTGDKVPKFDTPTTFATVVGRVYDVYHNPDLTDELGWLLVDTHDGTGTPYEITNPLQGFYRFEVRLPEEE
jgi:hypothetical protein